jgi:hypothetical protein
MKTYTAVGVAKKDGKYKIRWSNDNNYCVTYLSLRGETGIVIAGLSRGLNKRDGVLFIQDKPEFQEPDYQSAITEYLEKYTS